MKIAHFFSRQTFRCVPISSSSYLEPHFWIIEITSTHTHTHSTYITTMSPLSVTDSRVTADWLAYSPSPCHTPSRNVLEYRPSTPEAPEPRGNKHHPSTPSNDEWILSSSSSPPSSPRSVMGKQNLLIPLLNSSYDDDDIPLCLSIQPRIKRTRLSPKSEDFAVSSSPSSSSSASEFVIIKPKPISAIGIGAKKLTPRRHQVGGNLFSWEGQFLPINSSI